MYYKKNQTNWPKNKQQKKTHLTFGVQSVLVGVKKSFVLESWICHLTAVSQFPHL